MIGRIIGKALGSFPGILMLRANYDWSICFPER